MLVEGVEIEPVEAPQRRKHLLLDVLGLARSTTPHSPRHAQLLQDRLDGKEVQRAEVQVVVVVLRGGALLVRPARQAHLHRLRVAGAQVLVPVRGVHHGAPLLATVRKHHLEQKLAIAKHLSTRYSDRIEGLEYAEIPMVGGHPVWDRQERIHIKLIGLSVAL